MSDCDLLYDSNPFATRYVCPGIQPYLFARGENAQQLAERLRQYDGWGQIVGPHGSGKTTLLLTLRPYLEQFGWRMRWHTCRAGQRRLPPCAPPQDEALDETTMVIVDGYEQLGWWSRWRLRRCCRHASAGLLVTSHHEISLPVIYRTEPSLAIVEQLTRQLLVSGLPLITPDDVARAFDHCQGDVRETLFALYDLYELRRREQM